MARREDQLLISDILQSCELINQYVNSMSYDEFLKDRKTIDAVVRNFEVIGEASKMISDELKLKHPLIEWRMMADFRNILIHEYFGIDYEILWQSIIESLPFNFEFLKRIKF